MRHLHTERRAYRAMAAEEAPDAVTAGFAPGKFKIFMQNGLDPDDLRELLAVDRDMSDYVPLQPDPPAPPALRYWVVGLDDGIHDPNDPRYPMYSGPPPPGKKP
jgi:hypothetical protein